MEAKRGMEVHCHGGETNLTNFKFHSFLPHIFL